MKKSLVAVILGLAIAIGAQAAPTGTLMVMNQTIFPAAIYVNGSLVGSAGGGQNGGGADASSEQVAEHCSSVPMCPISVWLLKPTRQQVATAILNTDNGTLVSVTPTDDGFYYVQWGNGGQASSWINVKDYPNRK